MKKSMIILALFLGMLTINIHAQTDSPVSIPLNATIGIILNSNDVETIWNALRFAAFSRSEGDIVIVYLLGKGVELESLVKTNKDLKIEVNTFIQNGGFVLGSGICLANRKLNEPYICKLSSTEDLYNLVKKSKIVMTF